MITQPVNMSLTDWADQVCTDLEPKGFVGRLDGDDWQRWGAQLINTTGYKSASNPYLFSDWQTWGFRLCEELF